MNTEQEDPILDTRIGSLKTVKDRVQHLIGDASVNSKAKLWGVPTSTIAGMLERGTEPSIRNAVKIAAAEGVSLEWLATGEGLIQAQPTTLAVRAELGDDFVMVDDLSNVEAAAGSGAYVTDEGTTGRMAFRREWVEREGFKAQALRIIRARGDSMEPTIQDGAPILVEAFTYVDEDGNTRHLRSGRTPEEVVKTDGIYVIRLHERLLVKRLQLDLLGGLLVKSDNHAYDTLHIPAHQISEIAVIGRVVWTGRKL